MHQVTHISYGEGNVDIVLDSASQTEVSAPEFRFGDYSEVITSCFTPRELDKISEGENAQLTFYFVAYDTVEDGEIYSQYCAAIEEIEQEIGNLNEGVYVEIDAKKAIGNEGAVPVNTLSSDVELQMDIPLYLINEDRSFYFLTSNLGTCELLEDYTPDADVMTINTDSICSGLVLYQDSLESLIEKTDDILHIKAQHLFVAGIVLLIGLWGLIEQLHKRNKE